MNTSPIIIILVSLICKLVSRLFHRSADLIKNFKIFKQHAIYDYATSIVCFSLLLLLLLLLFLFCFCVRAFVYFQFQSNNPYAHPKCSLKSERNEEKKNGEETAIHLN